MRPHATLIVANLHHAVYIQTADKISYAFPQYCFVLSKYLPRKLLQVLVYCKTYIKFMEGYII